VSGSGLGIIAPALLNGAAWAPSPHEGPLSHGVMSFWLGMQKQCWECWEEILRGRWVRALCTQRAPGDYLLYLPEPTLSCCMAPSSP